MASSGHPASLIPYNSTWKYLDDNSDQGTGWRGPGFNDTSWASGPGQLGFGDGDEATVLNGGPSNNRFITFYFRLPFNVPDPGDYTNLVLNIIRDDGAVVYLNGNEIFRSNMPGGSIDNTTLATTAFPNQQENLPDTTDLDPAVLQAGANLLAVEIHQSAINSSDASFDLELIGEEATGGNLPPSVSLSSPPDDTTVASPADVTIQASASDTDGTVGLVEFFANGNKLGEDPSGPNYTFNWNNVPVGSHNLTAVATDNLGAQATSGAISLNITGSDPNVLIAAGSIWSYLDDGSDQSTEWRELVFDDSGWGSGPAELGYGDGDEVTTLLFGPDSNNKFPTTYFRHEFAVGDPSIYTYLSLRVKRDDGVVVYLNGAEIFRNNMPPGEPNYLTYTGSASGDDGSVFLPEAIINPMGLMAGNNVVAAEIHQANGNSSDISFDLELLASTEPIVNDPPTVTITSPFNNAVFSAPADIVINASASDPDDTVARVEFYRGTTLLGQDTSSPYSLSWNDVPEGSYQLRAVAFDTFDLSATSSVVNVSVSLPNLPTVQSVSPTPGTVTALNQITVTFSEAVTGVQATDLVINGLAAESVTGGSSSYTFGFDQPMGGTVYVGWVGVPGIQDFENPPQTFDPYGAGATWQYTLTDTVAPQIASIEPAPGATLASLDRITVRFTEPVTGVNGPDLLIGGLPASDVVGSGDGPYEFEFTQPNPGTIIVSWIGGHGIRDQSVPGNAFGGGGSWTYTLDTNLVLSGQVVINEIMFSPSSTDPAEEYIELLNVGAQSVNLTGWRLTRGVEFLFPAQSLGAGQYLVVAANVVAFQSKYPSVNNVVGGWVGGLSNNGEDIELEDASGNRVDLVEYADEGDWGIRRLVSNSLVWTSDADGLGRSMELRNPQLDNNTGQNWLASTTNQGTPGQPNSVASANIAPMILETAHFPILPTSSDLVTITARVEDELFTGLTVTLWWRVASVGSPGAFNSVAMADDGLNNDGAGDDTVYGVVLPAMSDGTIIEYYVEASDPGAQTRTWPAPILENGTPFQTANALFQVSNEVYTGTHAIYRLIMSAADRNGLFGNFDRIQRNATFITVEGGDTELRYLCDVRRRGASSFGSTPPTMKLNIPRDRRWNDKSSMNLNSVFTWAQVLGAAVSHKAGLAAAYARGVEMRFNGVNESSGGAQMYGLYAAVEALNGEWAEEHYPNDGGGNVYSKRRPECFFEYSASNGDDPQYYINCAYDKESNTTENDWTDLMALFRALDPDTTPGNEYLRALSVNVNVEQWLRYFAVSFLLNYNETALCTGADDDYDLYRGLVDPRFTVVPHDFDSIFGSAGNSANNIFIAANIPNISRMLHHSEIEPMFFAEYRRQLAGAFSTNNLFPLIDQYLQDWVPGTGGQSLQSIKNNALSRINDVLGALPPEPVVVRATISGEPVSPTSQNTATLVVGGAGITHYRYRVNGGAFNAQTAVGTPIQLNSLANGLYTVFVIGRLSDGTWQEESEATASRTWAVLSGLRGVRFNEILARNSSFGHQGTFPDVIELFNSGASTVNLEGMRLTDEEDAPDKYVFPAGQSITAGGYLLLYANNPDGTTGLHVGFSLDGAGETLYLFDRVSNGGRLLDSIEFGLQLVDRSVGRLANGQWGLTTPTLGSANTAVQTGSVSTLKINEWLAQGASPFLDDFIELYNPDPLPVSLDGLYFTDNPIGDPFKDRIKPLSFIAGQRYQAFLADDNEAQGGDHLNFNLSADLGEIALVNRDGSIIDCVIYGPQKAGIAEGRSPNGSSTIVFLEQPTPGVGNPTVAQPIPPQTVTLLAINADWRYEQSDTDLGTEWRDPLYNDAGWELGPGLLAVEDCNCLPEPIGTILTYTVPQQTAFYFRTHFNLDGNLDVSAIEIDHVVDDGAAFYINGQEVGRVNMPGGDVTHTTGALQSVGNASYGGPINVPLGAVQAGDNVIAVEVHQANLPSSDIVFGLRLNAVILTNTPASAGVVINEILANNATLDEADGSNPDWVEFYNPSDAGVDLEGRSLTDDLDEPQQWVFPVGSVVPPQGYLRIFFDSGAPASGNNTGFGLGAGGDELYLLDTPANGGSVLDGVTFGVQAPDWPIARVPDGTVNWVLGQPTPGVANLSVTLGSSTLIRINEWMADPASGDDWFELFNPNPQPVAIGGLHLTDNLNDRLQYEIPPLSFLGTGLLGFQEFKADNNPAAGADHVNFRLAAGGESLGLSDSIGTLIDSVTFGAQTTGVSQGRLPDGSATLAFFTITATPGDSNFLPINNVVINEVLAHTDPPLEDAIELRNLSGSPVNIGGWYLSDSQTVPKKYRIPDGITLPANGFRVFYETQFNVMPDTFTSFSLNSARGDEVWLSVATLAGDLTGFRANVEFAASENGVSFGRYATSVGVDITAMSLRTFGVDNPDTVQQFRTGMGLPNSSPKVGPIVINEIMYHPPDDGTNDNVLEEFVELHNISGSMAQLYHPTYRTNTWRLRRSISFDFPTNVSLLPGAFLLVVSFDPVQDASSLAAFRTQYGLSASVPIYGPYSGKLDNSGEAVELRKPDAPQLPPDPDAGFVPYIVADFVQYADLPPWPISADGSGNSLQRVTPSTYANDPANWGATVPTPGAINFGAAGNTPPVLGAIGDKSVIEGNLLSFTATATDADVPQQSLTYSLDPGAPAGANIHAATGLFTWTPTEVQGPGGYSITVRVTDNGTPNRSDAETISVLVNENNQAPTLNAISNQSIAEGVLLNFTAVGNDTDLPAQLLTYSLDPGAPSGASINAGTGVFSWTPSEAQGPGSYPVTVRVSDSASPAGSATRNLTINVSEVNQAPTLDPIEDRNIGGGQTVSLTATSTDPDLPAQAMTYSLDPGAPNGASIHGTTGAFTWTAPAGQTGVTNTVTVRVTDSGNPALNDTEVFRIIVTGAPRITDISPQGSGWRITWESVSGTTYQLLYKNELEDLTWQNAATAIQAMGPTTSQTNNPGANNQRFYQVRVVQ